MLADTLYFLHTCGQDVDFILQPTSCPHQGSFLTQTRIPCGLPAEFWQAGQAAEHNGKAVGVEKKPSWEFFKWLQEGGGAGRFLASHTVSWHGEDNPGNEM